MKLNFRNVVALCALIIFCSIIASLPSGLKYLAQEGLLEARRRGATLAWSDLTTSMTEVRVGSLTVWFPSPLVGGNRRMRVPIPLEVNDLTATLTPSTVLSLSPKALVSARAYDGEIRGEVNSGRDSLALTLVVSKAQLARHPLFSAIGCTDGKLSGSLEGATFVGNQLTKGAFTLSVADLAPPPIDDYLKLVKVDPIGPINGTVRGSLNTSTVDVTELTLSSSLFALSGTGVIREPNSPSPAINGSVKINLSPRGVNVIGPWLLLLTNGTAAADAETLACSISTRRCGGARMEIPIGSLCVSLNC